MSGFIQLSRGSSDLDDMLRGGYHNEFILLTCIARRARRVEGSIGETELYEARIGDYREIGLTEQKYRTAKKNLEKWQMITCKSTNKGTVAKLVNLGIYDINAIDANGQPIEPATDKQRTANEQATTKEKGKRVKGKKTTPHTPRGKYELPDWIDQNLFDEFLSERRMLKASNSSTAINRLIKKLSELSGNNPVVAKKIIEESIMNGWKGVFPLKENPKPQIVNSAPKLEAF